jgi:type 1 glutamine amidotransferase
MTTKNRSVVLGMTVVVALMGACGSNGGGAPAGGDGGSGGAPDEGGSGGAGGKATGGTGGAGGGGSLPPDAGVAADSAPPADATMATTGDAAALPDAANGSPDAGPGRVLIYTKTNGTTHVPGIAGATASLKTALAKLGITVDTANDATAFTAANLARYAGVIMVSTSGKPFGDPGTAEIQALVAFVQAGGGLAGFHAASSTDYGATGPFTSLLGAETKDQGGGFRTANCYAEAGTDNPAVAKLPNPFRVANEEFYTFNGLNPANQVVLRCDANTGTEKIPISWVREEGAGRVFYTGLGHYAQIWATGETFFTAHALPGILWTIRR